MRARWASYQHRIDPSRLVFIDETWTKTNMAALRGWAPVGERLKAKAPYGHWNTMTFIAALRHDRIEAPWLIDGPINGAALPALRRKGSRGQRSCQATSCWQDNLGSHKSKAVRTAIRNAGAHLIFLPKYSPDLNPLEQVIAKLKHLLRKAGARTIEAVCAEIGELLGTFTAAECAILRNAGYP